MKCERTRREENRVCEGSKHPPVQVLPAWAPAPAPARVAGQARARELAQRRRSGTKRAVTSFVDGVRGGGDLREIQGGDRETPVPGPSLLFCTGDFRSIGSQALKGLGPRERRIQSTTPKIQLGW